MSNNLFNYSRTVIDKQSWDKKMDTVNYLIENECFIQTPLLTAEEFVKVCCDCSLSISIEVLERLEKFRLFYPLIRIKKPHCKMKVKYTESRAFVNELGELEDGEIWNGEVIDKFYTINFIKDELTELYSEGYLWDPREKPFEKWENYYVNNEIAVISYYSLFQLFSLKKLLDKTNVTLDISFWTECSENQIQLDSDKLLMLTDFYKWPISDDSQRYLLPYLCQIISNRYYPITQTDQRLYKVKWPSPYINWDWQEFSQKWNSKEVSSLLNIDINLVKKWQDEIAATALIVDPLEKWYPLISFVCLDKKKKLKNHALLAQIFYSMEHMIRLFYKDITGEIIPSIEDKYFGRRGSRKYFDTENKMKQMEYTINRYHLNSRPKLILVLEGKGEEEQIPRLASEILGYSFPSVGIEVINLEGVGNFTGQKGKDKYGALARFIDDHHHRGTFVYVILDREGGGDKVKDKLIKKQSAYYPKRTITKEEYFCIWEKNIEFDNFSGAEIAYALTELCGQRYLFTAEDISIIKSDFSHKGDILSELYFEKTEYHLNKPELLKIMCDGIINNADNEFIDGMPQHPIINIIKNIIELANMNYLPVNDDIWRKNQSTGYWGTPIP